MIGATMAVSLTKGGNVSLEKVDPGITKAIIGLGWKARSTDGAPFDLDASALLVGENGKVRSDADFIFYNNATGEGVKHSGDNLTGGGDGDDEQILVHLGQVPANVQRVVIAVTIHDAEARRQNFGQVSDAYVRVVNHETNQEAIRYDLQEEASTETAMIFGELYRKNGGWSFRAIGQGYQGGLRGIATDYGVNVA